LSSEQDQVRQLAERIARRVAQSSAEQKTAQPSAGAGELNSEVAAMRHSLAELQQRLANIESHLKPEDAATRDTQRAAHSNHHATSRELATENPGPATRSPWLSGIYVPATHPSQEKFGVEEATVSELVDFFEGTKTCELEPGGKPCDHCAMCSSRGF
jgi:hypothetical protein